MSADRELLELAAKAAGYEGGYLFRAGGSKGSGLPYDIVGFQRVGGAMWNPLTDDGDRYRLAQKLAISIDFSDCCAWKRLPNGSLIQEFWGGECGDEPHAVLRAAAEIGKDMP